MVFGFSIRGMRAASVVCKVVAKIVEDWAKLMPKSFKIYQSSIPNQPKWCPGTFQGRSWKSVGSRTAPGADSEQHGGWFLEPFGATCRFWLPFGLQLGANGMPKSIILASRCIKNRKNGVQEGVPEKDRFCNGVLYEKGEVLSVLNPPKCFIYKHFSGFARLWQNLEVHQKTKPKWVPKWP